MAKPIQLPASCNFSDYFKLNCYAEDLLAYFGYQFATVELDPPKPRRELPKFDDLRERLRRSIPRIALDSETARREFLIAPVLMELLDLARAKLKIAYPIDAGPQLRGSLDYFIEANENLLVIEAKDENLERGFKQLAVELIAIARERSEATDAATEPQGNRWLWGAVSIGKIWQFGCLDRQEKAIAQDLSLYRVPADLELLMQILVGILTG